MMESRRLTAKKAGIAEIAEGKFVKKAGFESSYVLTNLGRRLSRVRVMGLIVDKFISDDGNYGTITLDDSTETLRCKVFVNPKMFDGINVGDLVDVVGKVKEYNGELYLVPETVRGVEPNMETLRILELKKIWKAQKESIKKVRALQSQVKDMAELGPLAKKSGMGAEDVEGIIEAQSLIENNEEQKVMETGEVKEKVLKFIMENDDGTGTDYQALLAKLGLPESAIDSAIQDLLEGGICFEPRAGKIKKL
jgi:RPA family protein